MSTPGPAAADRAPANGDALAPPPRWLLLCEGRAVYELASLWAVRPFLDLPRGDGHPVLVFPGFIASGTSTRPLRRFLKEQGYAAHCWKQGRNLGLQADLEHRMQARVHEMRRRYGRKVSLVGWSLGGVFAREVARAVPDDVRLVITLGSPFGAPKANHSWRLYNLLADTRIEDLDPAHFERMREPPPVPSTAIYTESDGITAWQSCLERPGPLSESIAVTGSHCGLGVNPLAYTAIADRLAQPAGRWRPFRRSGLRRHLFRRPRYHLAGF
jgi:pimeloyl-ACP methyl ester carboxylesterase